MATIDPASCGWADSNLANPIMVASGTFGYAREMAGSGRSGTLGGHRSQDDHRPSRGRATLLGGRSRRPPGMLNSIGLDNDGIAAFIEHHLPYLGGLGAPIVVSIAAHDYDEFVAMAERLGPATGLAGDRAESFLPQRLGRGRFRDRCRDVPPRGGRALALPAAGRSWPS